MLQIFSNSAFHKFISLLGKHFLSTHSMPGESGKAQPNLAGCGGPGVLWEHQRTS